MGQLESEKLREASFTVFSRFSWGLHLFLMAKSEEKFPAGSGRWGQKAIILRCAQNILYDKSLF